MRRNSEVETLVSSVNSPLSTTRRTALRAAALGIAAIGSGAALSACGSDGGRTGKTATGATKFIAESSKLDSDFVDMVCNAQNLFAKHGLSIPKFLYPSSGVQAMQLLVGGSANGTSQDTVLAMAAYANQEKGERPAMIGMRIPENTYSIVVGKGSWPSDTANFEEKMHALKGKTIGVTAVGAGSDRQLNLALEAAGMAVKDVTHLGIGLPTVGISQLKGGKIDAYVGLTFATAEFMIAETGGRALVRFADPGVPELLSKQQIYCLLVRESYARAHKDVCKKWLSAQSEANDWITKNKAAASKLLNQTAFSGHAEGASTAFINHYIDEIIPKINNNWAVSRESFDFMKQVATKVGAITSGQLSFEAMVPEFARSAS